MNATINRKLILLLKFARNSYLGSKKLVSRSINDNFCAAKLTNSANCAGSAFFREIHDELCQKLCQHNLSKPRNCVGGFSGVKGATHKLANSPLQKLSGERNAWVYKLLKKRSLGADKRRLWLVNGCLEYHRPIITNACQSKLSQKSLHSKFAPILPRLCEVGNTGTLSYRCVFTHVASIYANLLEQQKAFA